MFDVNDPRAFDELSKEEQAILLSWIKRNFIMIETFNVKHSSYDLKHVFENEGVYITNGQFKGAMLKAGFSVKDMKADNWNFNISQKSPGIQRMKLM